VRESNGWTISAGQADTYVDLGFFHDATLSDNLRSL
jgi:hypothetical protein